MEGESSFPLEGSEEGAKQAASALGFSRAAGPRARPSLARLRGARAGELDPTFGGDGKVVTDFGGDDQASGVAIQADGKIVAAGVAANAANFELARYNPDGTLDPSFDGDGRVVTDFGGDDGASSVAIQADGKIVAAGFVQGSVNRTNFALARYNPDGTLDSSFDGDGKVVTDFGGGEGATDVAIQTDGKVVAAGVTDPPTRATDFALARYNPDGTLDSSFDGDGKVVTGFGGDKSDEASGVAIQANGKIVAAGHSHTGANPFNFALARYNPDGNLDPTFSGDGRVRTEFGSVREFVGDVAIQANGKIVVAATATPVRSPPTSRARATAPAAASTRPSLATGRS